MFNVRWLWNRRARFEETNVNPALSQMLRLLKKIRAHSAHGRGYIFNNKDTSQPSFYRKRARVIMRYREKRSTQQPALKLEPTPLQATASLRPLFHIFRLFDALSDGFPSFPKLFTVYNQHARIITLKKREERNDKKERNKFSIKNKV